MNKCNFTLAGIVLATVLTIGWVPLSTDDSGTMYTDGLHFGVYRDFTGWHHEDVHNARTSYMGRQSKYFIKFTRGNEEIETLIIGFGGLKLAVFDAPCSPLDEDDAHYGRFELVRSLNPGPVDSIRDWDSEPLVISPPVLVPSVGYTERSFFSSTVRLQGNSWDGFVHVYNEDLLPGYYGVIRFVPLDSAGFLIDDREVTALLAYSTWTSAEDYFLDIGDPQIVYLTESEQANYHGLLLSGICRRIPGTSQRARFSFCMPNGNLAAIKEITIPWTSETQTRMPLYVGVTSGFVGMYPSITIVTNIREEGEVNQCRLDSLWLYPRP